jgi:hypothetical protein
MRNAKTTIMLVAVLLLAIPMGAAYAAERARTVYGRIVKSNLPPMPDGWEPPHEEPVVPIEERYLARPLVDTPLRSPSVCKGPDGTCYLIGAAPVKHDDGTLDWETGTEIHLWKSADLKTWEEVGVVWDLAKAGWTPKAGNAINWAKGPRGKPGEADSLRHSFAVTAPEIHYLKGTFWIPFSVSDVGTGLLKSTTGEAEGPYTVNPDYSVFLR